MKITQWLWRGVILIILVVLGVVLVTTVQNTLSQQLQPVKEMSGKLSTQVAQVLNPTPTILPDPVTIIHEIRTLARLETIKFSVETIITA